MKTKKKAVVVVHPFYMRYAPPPRISFLKKMALQCLVGKIPDNELSEFVKDRNSEILESVSKYERGLFRILKAVSKGEPIILLEESKHVRETLGRMSESGIRPPTETISTMRSSPIPESTWTLLKLHRLLKKEWQFSRLIHILESLNIHSIGLAGSMYGKYEGPFFGHLGCVGYTYRALERRFDTGLIDGAVLNFAEVDGSLE